MASTIDKKIKVSWPGGGQTGPYNVTFEDDTVYEVWVSGRTCIIPRTWCNLVEPEIEEGRLYWVDSRTAVVVGNRALPGVIKEPVHRRWNELPVESREDFCAVTQDYTEEDIYLYAYYLITSEVHP